MWDLGISDRRLHSNGESDSEVSGNPMRGRYSGITRVCGHRVADPLASQVPFWHCLGTSQGTPLPDPSFQTGDVVGHCLP